MNIIGNKISYSKPAVEKFIFNKIYSVIFELYNVKYKHENELFIEKIKKINEKIQYDEIMEYLEVS